MAMRCDIGFTFNQALSTFQQLYCAACGCAPGGYQQRVFRACLHRRALVLSWLLSWLSPGYFDPDRELIAEAGRAKTLHELEDEIHDYALDARNLTWWRKHARFRLSIRRLRRLARQHLPQKPVRTIA